MKTALVLMLVLLSAGCPQWLVDITGGECVWAHKEHIMTPQYNDVQYFPDETVIIHQVGSPIGSMILPNRYELVPEWAVIDGRDGWEVVYIGARLECDTDGTLKPWLIAGVPYGFESLDATTIYITNWAEMSLVRCGY